MRDLIGEAWDDLLPHIEDELRSNEMRQSTWTLTAVARSSWDIPRVLERVTGVKTSDKSRVADDMYKRLPECHEVQIKKENSRGVV